MGENIHTITRVDRGHLHDTDSGMNRQEAFRVSQLESKIRNRKTEKGYVVDDRGNIIAESFGGSRSAARFRIPDLMKTKDAILTHNHPNAEMGGSIAARIGLPFSNKDLENAVRYDHKEIRAVTPNYTYSVRRPKGGWGDRSAIMKALREWDADRRGEYYSYMGASYRRGADRNESNDRANVVGQWKAWKKAMKSLGWEITRKRVK